MLMALAIGPYEYQRCKFDLYPLQEEHGSLTDVGIWGVGKWEVQ